MTADKRYDGTAGKIFGYGTTYYYWTGKQGTANSSTSSLKADYGIDIGFLGNGQGSGNINVTSNQDMVLAGNISNAAVIDNSGDSNYKGLGNVTLTSNHEQLRRWATQKSILTMSWSGLIQGFRSIMRLSAAKLQLMQQRMRVISTSCLTGAI